MSGLPRAREWDASSILELPELEASDLSRFEFRSLADGTLVVDQDVAVEPVERVARWGDGELGRPYAASVVRRDRRMWAVGLTRVHAEPIDLPELEAFSLELAFPPRGIETLAIDGEEADRFVAPAVAAAVAELERRGRLRFEAFVARADRLDDGRWELTVDPL